MHPDRISGPFSKKSLGFFIFATLASLYSSAALGLYAVSFKTERQRQYVCADVGSNPTAAFFSRNSSCHISSLSQHRLRPTAKVVRDLAWGAATLEHTRRKRLVISK